MPKGQYIFTDKDHPGEYFDSLRGVWLRGTGEYEPPKPYATTAVRTNGSRLDDARTMVGNFLPNAANIPIGIANLPSNLSKDPFGTAKNMAYGLVEPYVNLATDTRRQVVEHPAETLLSLIPGYGILRAGMKTGLAGALAEAGEQSGLSAGTRGVKAAVKGKPVLPALARPKPTAPTIFASDGQNLSGGALDALSRSGLSVAAQRALMKNKAFRDAWNRRSQVSGVNPASARHAALDVAGVDPAYITRSMVTREAPHPNLMDNAAAKRQAALDQISRKPKPMPAPVPAPVQAPARTPIAISTPMGKYTPQGGGTWLDKNGMPAPDMLVPSLREQHIAQAGWDPEIPQPTVTEMPPVVAPFSPRPSGVKGIAHDILSEDQTAYTPHPAGVGIPSQASGLSNAAADTALTLAGHVPYLRYPAEAVRLVKDFVINKDRNRNTLTPEEMSQELAGAPKLSTPYDPGLFRYGPAALLTNATSQNAGPNTTQPPSVEASSLSHKGYAPGAPMPDEDVPQGQWRGGRTAYKSGGKVSSAVEPLVQNLMIGYKKAKSAEVATTKPLLQHSDQTIVRALRVAKKAI
jgi:hypothetical protein